jgi:Ser/Thr protein kinase RdoA (MazF antagonist)
MNVLRSIISPNFISRVVSEKYRLQDISNCTLIKSGGSNDIYKINNKNKKYIVKIYSIRKCWPYDLDHYLFELELQTFLHHKKISVPLPLLNRNNSLISKVSAPEYDKYFAVYTFLDGEVCEHKKSNEETFFTLGKSLGDLHAEGQSFSPSHKNKRFLNRDFLLSAPYQRIQMCGVENSFSDKFIETIDRFYNQLNNSLNEANLSKLQTGIIHGDTHPENFILSKKNQLVSFLDFELCGHGYYIYDLATFKWKLYLSAKPEDFEEKFKQFIEGYLVAMPHLNSEISFIDLFVRLRHFFILGSSIILYPDNPQLIYENNFMEYIHSLNNCPNLMQDNHPNLLI